MFVWSGNKADAVLRKLKKMCANLAANKKQQRSTTVGDHLLVQTL